MFYFLKGNSVFLLLLITCCMAANAQKKANTANRSFYELRIYHTANSQQIASLDQYLEKAFLPAMHQLGYKTIGVFKSVNNDTAADKKVYVLIPHTTLSSFATLEQQLQKNNTLQQTGSDYINAAYNQPTYTRYETILMQAFERAPQLTLPQLKNPKSERIYELRSYEGPTEKLYRNKVQMFNKGDEVGLFKRLGFNAVFYGEVLSGSHMPNLMYMTTFENRQDREAHWKAFSSDPYWKQLSAMPEYQHNVSHSDILFLTPTDYSDI